MGFEQIEIPDSGICMQVDGKECRLIGVQMETAKDRSGQWTAISLIDDSSSKKHVRVTLQGTSYSMSRLIESMRKHVPVASVYDTGKYCIVSQLGEKLLITLTEEGKDALEEEGALGWMFDEMDNGTVLNLSMTSTFRDIEPPLIHVSSRPTRIGPEGTDTRIWHWPESLKSGKKQFWRHLHKNGYIILELAKFR